VDLGRYLSLAAFIAAVLGLGLLIGLATMPGPWYEALEKPFFNPPNWLFGPAWSVLYVLIGIAGWRVWRSGDSGLLTAWIVQLALNFLWSPVFFGLQSIGGALIVILALLAAILAFIALAWRRDRTAAWLFVPYALWVAFATTLNVSIHMRN
jgi:tryptophan-rich sensory protein